MFLHGNCIATRAHFGAELKDNQFMISAAGWKTNTTKERLNGLPGVSIRQKKGEWYLNGKLWDGNWIIIK